MRRKGRRGTLLSVIIALALVAALLLAGTLLRMKSRSMPAGEAFKSFVSDTFSFN